MASLSQLSEWNVANPVLLWLLDVRRPLRHGMFCFKGIEHLHCRALSKIKRNTRAFETHLGTVNICGRCHHKTSFSICIVISQFAFLSFLISYSCCTSAFIGSIIAYLRKRCVFHIPFDRAWAPVQILHFCGQCLERSWWASSWVRTSCSHIQHGSSWLRRASSRRRRKSASLAGA